MEKEKVIESILGREETRYKKQETKILKLYLGLFLVSWNFSPRGSIEYKNTQSLL